jgi:hypothetical protein
MCTLRSALALLLATVCPALAIDLAPVADTYIQAGIEAETDHGHSSLLLVDRTPFTIAYLRFDLRGIGSAVTNATLRLTVADSSPTAGAVYRVRSNAWEETLRWNDIDSNEDGVLDGRDAERFVPDKARLVGTIGAVFAGQTIAIDVTGAFAAGPGIYSLGVMTTSADSAGFWSREDPARAPVLSVTTAADTPTPTSACLAGAGPLVVASGTFRQTWSRRSLAARTRIDARHGLFLGSHQNNYPITLGGDANVCIAGGVVQGEYDRNASWQTMHDENNAGITFDSRALTVEGIRIDNVTDGIRPRATTEGFTITGVHLSWVRDDCVENDQLRGGVVEDSLFDGCYVAFSSRPADDDTSSNGRGRVWRIENSLVRLVPMPGPRRGSNAHPDGLGHGGFFKVDQWDDPANSRSPSFVLRNNVFRADRVGQESNRRMGLPPEQVRTCENNVMVWLGPGNYPAPLPACFRVTKDPKVWDDAVARWTARHPVP